LRRRRYVGKRWFALLSPLLRYSYSRDAYILRGVGRRVGPVLRQDRRNPRRRPRPADGIERRQAGIA
jgi:hypothetical protein